MPISLAVFTEQLASSGLISADELSSLLDSLPPERKADGEQLARELVRQKRLTAFQAQQIYQSKGKHLVLGNYVALDKLGQGGMGMVLKAEHKRMKRLVALKVLSPNVTKTPEALRRFQREVEAAAKLNHTNIVTAFDADEAAGTRFLVMEYVEGTDLSDLVKKNGPLAIDKALNCVIQAARGLEFAHANGVVHRDIKPANLLLDRSGTIKILDMGLARLDSAGGQQDQLTGTGQIMGTVDYMAPEQAMDTKSADARADIYSLGVTLWNLLTGRALYDGDTTVMKLMAHQNKPIPSLRGACPAASTDLEAVFNRMVAKTPEARYQTMTEVIADLERCQGGQAVAPSVSMGPGEDTRLNDFLRDMGQTGTGGASVGGVALQQAAAPATAVAPQTINLSNALVGTDPQTQRSLSPSVLGALAGRRAARRHWLDRLPVPPKYRLPVLIGGGLAAVLLAGIVLFWQTDDGTTVRIEINDPQITVRLDGTGATLTHLDKGEIKLEPGQHGLRINVGDLDFETDKFVLADGDDMHLRIDLLDGQVQVAQGDKSLGLRPMPDEAGNADSGNAAARPTIAGSAVEDSTSVGRTVPKAPSARAADGATPMPTPPAASPGEAVDLLALVDLSRDTLHHELWGEWTRDGQTLISPGGNKSGRIQVPYEFPPEYELTAVVERLEGTDGVMFGFLLAGHPAQLGIDVFLPPISGISMIDGQYVDMNESAFREAVLTDREPHTIRITVDKRSVRATVDDREVINWTGDPRRLTMAEGVNHRQVSFGAAYHQFKFHKLEIRPLGENPNPRRALAAWLLDNKFKFTADGLQSDALQGQSLPADLPRITAVELRDVTDAQAREFADLAAPLDSVVNAIVAPAPGFGKSGLEQICRVKSISDLYFAPGALASQDCAPLATLPNLKSINIDNGPGLDDSIMTTLKQCPELGQLLLNACAITDKGLEEVSEFPRLRLLYLNSTSRVTDKCWAMLAKSDSLESLTIYAADGMTGQGISSLRTTSIDSLILSCLDDATIEEVASLPLHTLGAKCPSLTDAGLKHLVGTRLTLLYLTGSKVTEAGVKQLAAALPACRIVWDGGTIEPTAPGNGAPAK